LALTFQTRNAIQVERLRGTPAADAVASPSCAVQTNSPRSLNDHYVNTFLLGHDKARILELAGRALEELTTMCTSGEPLWVRSVETGRDLLNYDEYLRLFPHDDSSGGDRRTGWSVEASRETGVAYLHTERLVHAFMDVIHDVHQHFSACWDCEHVRTYSARVTEFPFMVFFLNFWVQNQWKELFPSMVSKASTLSVIQTGENDDQDGVVQLVYVPTHVVLIALNCA
jgi:homeobox-leucine zipper protein